MTRAASVTLSFDPTAAGLTGAAFQADALVGGEVSRINNGPTQPDGSFTWHETGYLNITGTVLNGVAAVPSGLGSTYTMYMSFDIDGYQPNILALGQALSGTFGLFMVNGASQFGFDGSGAAQVDNGANTPVKIASVILGSLTTSATLVSPPPNLALSLSAALTGDLITELGGAISSPTALTTVFGAFSHPSEGVTIVNGGQAFQITGGNDVLTFDAPEPASVAILAVGLLGLAAAGRRRAGQTVMPNSAASNA